MLREAELSAKEIRAFSPQVVRRVQSLDAPLRGDGDVIILQIPNVDGEGSAVGVELLVKGVAVGVELLVKGVAVGVVPLLEDIRHQANVLALPLQITPGSAAPTDATALLMFFHRTCHSSVVVGDDADDMIVLKHIVSTDTKIHSEYKISKHNIYMVLIDPPT